MKMKPINMFTLLTFTISSFLFAQSNSDFEDGSTQGWHMGSSSNATNISTGGPDGTDDNYLQLAPDAAGKAGKLVVLNTSHWTGNYIDSGIVNISFHVNNISLSSTIDLRIALRVDGGAVRSDNSWASSTNSIHLSNSAGWQEVSLPIEAANLSALGSTPVTTILSNVAEIRILDATSAPSRQGDSSTDILGLDNITAISNAVSLGPDIKRNYISPETINLLQNYPNPFNPSTMITVEINPSVNSLPGISIEIFNLAGQKTVTLFNGALNTGSHTFYWDGKSYFGSDASSGVYIYRVRSGKINISKRMVLIR